MFGLSSKIHTICKDLIFSVAFRIQRTLHWTVSMIVRDSGSISFEFSRYFDFGYFSAELCAVTFIEETTQQVIDFSIVHKSEVNNVSGRMELEGVKKTLNSVEKHVKIGNITTDKHLQVCAYLRSENYRYWFDTWHKMKSVKKDIKRLLALMQAEEKDQLKSLGKRFIKHVYSSVEFADGDIDASRELVFSFFLHVQGVHQWNPGKFMDTIPIAQDTKICPRFKKEKFSQILQCRHDDASVLEPQHEVVNPNSKPYQALLGIAASTAFMNDLDRLRKGTMTSEVESFHNVCIRYRPKRKYFPKKGFELRTMLAALSWNENKNAESRGNRKVSEVYECFSKSRDEKVTKVKKNPICEDWKQAIVDDSIERKRQHGPGIPFEGVQNDLDEGIDIIRNQFEELQNFSDSENDFDE